MQNNEFFSKIVGYVIPFGSLSDPVGLEGLANVLVDSYSYGTKKYPTTELLFNALESTGAEFSAQAGQQQIYIYISAPRDNIAEAERILDEIVENTITSEETLEKLKKTLISKIEEIKSNAIQHAFDLFKQMVMPVRQDLGTKESVSKIKLTDLQELQEKIKNSRARYSISSNSNFEVQDYKSPEVDGVIYPSNPASRTKFNDKKHDQKTLLFGYRTGGSSLFDYGVRHVATAVMHSGLVGLAMEVIREEKAAAYFAGYGHRLSLEKGASFMYAGVSEKNVYEVVEAMEELYQRGSKADFEESRIENAQSYFLGQIGRSYDSLDSIAGLSLSFLAEGKELPTIDTITQSVNAVTRNHVAEYFSSIINNSDQYCVVNGVTSQELKNKLTKIVK